MANYETTKIVKTLRFPGDVNNQYQINAVALDGLTKQAIEQRLDNLESLDALRYVGTLNAGATLPEANRGDVYKVASKGTIAGASVEVGDMLICNKDGTPANTPANWDIIQGNVDVDAILDHTHTITLNTYTPAGSVAQHKHNVTLTPTNVTNKPLVSVTATWSKPADATDSDGILTIGTTQSNETYLSSVTVSENDVAPTFTGTAAAPTVKSVSKGELN